MQNNNSIYKNKYIKYKQKYLDLKMHGGMLSGTQSGALTSRYTYSDFKRDFSPSDIIIINNNVKYVISIRYNESTNRFYFDTLTKYVDSILSISVKLEYDNKPDTDNGEVNGEVFDDYELNIINILRRLNIFMLSHNIMINNIQKLIYNNNTLKLDIKNIIIKLINYMQTNNNPTININNHFIIFFNRLEGTQYIDINGNPITYNINGKEAITLSNGISLDEHGNFMNGNEVIMYSKNLVEPWYTEIKENRKTIEGRVLKYDWLCMNKGDYINFYVYDVGNKRHNIFVQIVDIHKINFGEIGDYLVTNSKVNALFGNILSLDDVSINDIRSKVDVQTYSNSVYTKWNAITSETTFSLITIKKVDDKDLDVSVDIKSIITSLKLYYDIE